jgi:hypothetical protein
MKEVAELLGVTLGKEFKIKADKLIVTGTFILEEKGLYRTGFGVIDTPYTNGDTYLLSLLNGNYIVMEEE